MRLTPDYLFDSYREITPDFLHRQGIALLLTDLDYTLAPKAVRRPNEALKSWIAELQGAGITVMIVSNNRSGTRVTEFCADLGIGYQGHAGKPSPRGLEAAMKRTGIDPAHTAMLGDKLLTDMLAAHRAGVTALMVEPLGGPVGVWNHVLHLLQRPFKAACPCKYQKNRVKTQNKQKTTCNSGRNGLKYHRPIFRRVRKCPLHGRFLVKICEEDLTMPISAGDFRKGVVFEMDGKPMLVVDFQHVKPGKGAAFVRTKYKNVMTGAIREESFNPSAKFENGTVERRNAEYSYNDGDLYYFMDPETYDMTPLNKDVLGDSFQFVKENTMCTLVSYKGNVFSVEAPNFMELEVTATEPGVKGDTATNVTKPATLETGAIIKVPLFINEGEKIQVDTRTGEYLGRVKE